MQIMRRGCKGSGKTEKETFLGPPFQYRSYLRPHVPTTRFRWKSITELNLIRNIPKWIFGVCGSSLENPILLPENINSSKWWSVQEFWAKISMFIGLSKWLIPLQESVRYLVSNTWIQFFHLTRILKSTKNCPISNISN